METKAKERDAATLIAQHWEEGSQLHTLPELLRPASRREGYSIQAHFEAMSAQPLFGWKIAATSDGGQRHIGVDGPLAGRLLAERVIAADDTPSLRGNHMRVAEPEFAFRMAKSLPPQTLPYDRAKVLTAVDTLFLGIELPDSRFVDFANVGGPQLIADNACAHQFLLGQEAAEDWRACDLSRQHVSIAVADGIRHEGSGGAVLGDPIAALVWLVNELRSLDITLERGHVVTTGTATIPLPIEPGHHITADFGHLGQIQLEIAS
ncbi:MAG: hydratase [Pseudomonadota bacterium]